MFIDRTFTSAFEAECFHLSLGMNRWRVVQTSPGCFKYRIELLATEHLTTYRCTHSTEMLFQGDGAGDGLFFCFASVPSIDHGVENIETDVFGIQTSPSEVCYLMRPGFFIAHKVSRAFFDKIMLAVESATPGQSEMVRQLLTDSMKFQLLPLDMQLLWDATSWRLANPHLIDEAKNEQLVLLIAQLALRAEKPMKLGAVPERNDSIVQLVQQQFDSNCFRKMKLIDVAESLSYSSRSLQLASQAVMNRGPMDTLTAVRLEQARRALTNRDCHEAWIAETGLKPTCGNVFKWYDLGTKAGLAYKEMFGVTPKQDQKDSLN